MKKNKTNLSVVNNAGIRVKPNILVGDSGSYSSGDILDANAVDKVVKDKINELINGADDAMNTLKELADAIPEVPTNVSDLDNDAGYLTQDTIVVQSGSANGHDYIEIGGIKWATMNVGANSITDTGLYFQWGDIQGYTAAQVGNGSGQKYFGGNDYKWSEDEGQTFTKYNDEDGLITLEASDDAVTAAWGGNWRMPTVSEFIALGEAVNTAWTNDYQGSGIAGLVCTDKTDSSKVLFFPACGFASYGGVYAVGICGYGWSSSLLADYGGSTAYGLNFDDGDDESTGLRMDWQYDYDNRDSGFPVRGVCDLSTQNISQAIISDRQRIAALEQAIAQIQAS